MVTNSRPATKTLAQETAPKSEGVAPSPAAAHLTKRASVIALIAREDGATLPELIAATGWQAHSVRAMLTGLRKSGLVLEKSIRDGITCYQQVEATNARG